MWAGTKEDRARLRGFRQPPECGASLGPKLVIIGIDGADFDVMQPYLEEGALPNIRRLMIEGSWGPLKTTIPPITPCAWTTMLTGTNAGRHGIFAWRTLIPGSYCWVPTRSGHRKQPALWELVNRHGLTAGVFNVPMTYPAEAVGGFMVSGVVGAPGVRSAAFWPRELMHSVLRVAPDYSTKRLRGTPATFSLEQMTRIIEQSREIIVMLLKQYHVDVFIAVVSYVDWVQHSWLAVDRLRHPSANEVIREAYVGADKFIGAVLGQVPPDADILIVSDHGAAPTDVYLNLERLLHELGWTALRGPLVRPLTRLAVTARRGLRKLLPTRYPLSGLAPVATHLEWSKCAVYSMGIDISLRVNLRTREPQGTVNPAESAGFLCEVRDKLASLTFSDGLTIAFDLFGRDELFSGPHTDLLPDLIGQSSNMSVHTIPHRDQWLKEPALLRPEEALSRGNGQTLVAGGHRLEEVFIACGPSFETGRVLGPLYVADVAPTVLHALRLPVPVSIEGRPITEAFRDPMREVVRGEAVSRELGQDAIGVYGEDEAAEVERHLEELGYL